MFYDKELDAIKRSGRFRERKIFSDNLYDFASNDYLGFADNEDRLKVVYEKLSSYSSITPKASMLVNGYHPVHKEFEEFVSSINSFEDAICVGSGFLANISLIESLVRKRDILLIDEEYHASGILPSALHGDRAIRFRHNNPQDLRDKLKQINANRVIIAVEGVYSMGGDVVDREIFDIAGEFGAILIVDEAHSSGVLGDNLTGVFEYYGIEVEPNHIKMGTLGKAYGSYGAYICASKEITDYLVNRAKPIIYSTAPSVFDIALALENMREIYHGSDCYNEMIKERRQVVKDVLDIEIESLILPVEIGLNTEVMEIQSKLLEKGFIVGAIRQPTVDSAILRIIPRLGESEKALDRLCREIDILVIGNW